MEPAGFFAMRTPLFPFDDLAGWSEGLEAAALEAGAPALEPALARDRRRLRERLREILERPEMREALFVASPDLADAVPLWGADPESARGRRAERALVRYFERSAGRATPFGLCAGCSVGTLGDATRLILEGRDRYRRRSRLDMDYLSALTDALTREPAWQGWLRYRPNDSLYRAGGRIRYVESRLAGEARTHHLVALEATGALEETLARARGGATRAELAAALVDDETSREEADAYLAELVESQVLVPELGFPVTGPDPVAALLGQMDGHAAAAPVAAALGEAHRRLAGIDAEGVGIDPHRYRALAGVLEPLPAKVERARLVQVDMVKPCAATLGAAVVSEVANAVDILRRLARPPAGGLARFRDAFRARYEARAVPLVEALDEESGIGFAEPEGAAGEPAPLLRELDLPGAPDEEVRWGARERWLLDVLSGALAAGSREVALSAPELDEVAEPRPARLPAALSVVATLAAASREAVDRGDFRVLVRGAGGPSGARLLGRFCDADETLRRCALSHLRAEEALDPEALFAEVVHLPEGRVGNILLRPVLRGYEIPFLGRSGAPEERQIPVADLRVSVEGDEVVLRSARLGRRIVPRLTSAHNYTARALPLYRLLCALQEQGHAATLGWSWGPLRSAPFRPRVRSGRAILALARWRLGKREVARLRGQRGAARFRAVQAWRRDRSLPRWVVLAEGDHTLPVDLDNALSVDAFVDALDAEREAEIEELYPGPAELCATGPEGRFVHEPVIPFTAPASQRPRDPAPGGSGPASVSHSARLFRRTLPPGSEWLYAKVYTGPAGVDGVLRDVVEPLVRDLGGSGAIDRWFFVRYADPDHHLRLRLHGSPEALHDAALPALQGAMGPLLDGGRAWRVQTDTYEREVERYGGPEGMAVAERIFHADSEAVLELLTLLDPGDPGEEERWRLGLRGADQLLRDLGLDADAARALARRLRESFGEEHRADRRVRQQLARKYRGLARELDALLDRGNDAESALGPGLEVLQQRSSRLAPLVRELRDLERVGRLGAPVSRLAYSYVHMHLNRLLRSAPRAQELVLYDFLDRLYASRAARERRPAPSPGLSGLRPALRVARARR